MPSPRFFANSRRLAGSVRLRYRERGSSAVAGSLDLASAVGFFARPMEGMARCASCAMPDVEHIARLRVGLVSLSRYDAPHLNTVRDIHACVSARKDASKIGRAHV